MGALIISNSFPFSLIRRKVVVEPRTVAELQAAMRDRPWVSAWGHANTVELSSAIACADLRPASERPILSLTSELLPRLNDGVYNECWLLSPDYVPNFRPKIGEEVSADKILGWQVLQLTWLEA